MPASAILIYYNEDRNMAFVDKNFGWQKVAEEEELTTEQIKMRALNITMAINNINSLIDIFIEDSEKLGIFKRPEPFLVDLKNNLSSLKTSWRGTKGVVARAIKAQNLEI